MLLFIFAESLATACKAVSGPILLTKEHMLASTPLIPVVLLLASSFQISVLQFTSFLQV